MPPRGSVTAAATAAALAVDAVLVVAFAAAGRASHHGDILLGLWTTAWPFLAALAVGWVATLAWRRPLAPGRTGIPLWIVTVAGGMILRALSGHGTAVPFVLVAAGTLALLLIGWRLVALLARRVRTRRLEA